MAGLHRLLTGAHELFLAGGQGAPLPTSAAGSVPGAPAGVSGLADGVVRAGGSYQRAQTGAAGLDEALQTAAAQGGAIGQQGRVGAGLIRDQARATAASLMPIAKSAAGAQLMMAAMDQHLSAMQGQLRSTKTRYPGVSATLQQVSAGYQTLANGAKNSPPAVPLDATKPGDPVPASPASPPVATDPRNPFIGDPRFGYWKDYVPAPYTGTAPPPPPTQHVPFDGPPGGSTGFYTPGRTWIGDNDAPFAAYQEQYRFRIAGEDLTSYTRTGPDGHPQRWVAYTYEAQQSKTSVSTVTCGRRRRQTRARVPAAMTGLLIGKVLLVAFVAVACIVVAIIYVRRRRAGVQPWKNPEASPYLDIYRGGLPSVPPPPQAARARPDGEPPALGADGGLSPNAD